LNTFVDELSVFFWLGSWVTMIQNNDYSSLRTATGLLNAIGPLLAILLVIEVIRALWTRTFMARHYRTLFLVFVFNRVLSVWITIALGSFLIGLLTPYQPFSLGLSWYGLIYGYVVWELGHFIYHYSTHKVRLLWCLHSTHHAPESMNLLVGHAHFFLEAPYADLIRISVCTLLGLSPPLLIAIVLIDSFWGSFVHTGEHILKEGRLGFLERWILTPSHHRVHHARNPLYIDTNFCNLLNIWDRIFGTYQPEQKEVPTEYGIRRKVDAGSFRDIYFGEIVLLAKDVWGAPGSVNKLLYLVMPPGWSHTGGHKTASALRRNTAPGLPIYQTMSDFRPSCVAEGPQLTPLNDGFTPS
jgi:sterol desaturase/sphingolipid hydroxylase (fatty acid hydroxylase superfamily)